MWWRKTRGFIILCCVPFPCPPTASLCPSLPCRVLWEAALCHCRSPLPFGLLLLWPWGSPSRKLKRAGSVRSGYLFFWLPPCEAASGWLCPLTEGYCSSEGGFSSWLSASGHFSLPSFLVPGCGSSSATAERPLSHITFGAFPHPECVVACSFVNKPLRLFGPDHRGICVSS